MSLVEVSISGHSSLHRYPERGIIKINIQSSGTSQEEVSEDVRSATERVSKQFEALYRADAETDAAITYWTVNSLTTRSWTESEYDDDDKVSKQWKKYEAIASADAIFRDFEKLSEVASALSVTKYVTITGTQWIILSETEQSMIAESVKEAYASALVKARAYADEMGLTTVKPIKITDSGEHQSNSSSSATSHSRTKQTARRSARDTGGPTPIPSSKMVTFVPRDVTLSGRCEVVFEIS